MRAICGVHLKDIMRVMDFMLMFGLNETINQLPMTHSVNQYGHLLKMQDGHVSRKAFDFEVEGRRGGREVLGRGRLRKKR